MVCNDEAVLWKWTNSPKFFLIGINCLGWVFFVNGGHLSWSLSIVKTVGTFWFLCWVHTSSVSSVPCSGHSRTDNCSVVQLAFSQDLPWNTVSLCLIGAIFGCLVFLPFFFLLTRSVLFCQVFRSQLSVSSVSDQDAYRAGLQPVSQWKAYGLNGYPGRYFWLQEKLNTTVLLWIQSSSILSSLPCLKKLF